MSHPVFLSSSPWPRMPEGRRNELGPFVAARGAELEANGSFPLFWRLLFEPGDLRFAHFIDEWDVADENCAIEREEALADFGTEARYPYLVSTLPEALSRLAAHREAVLAALGERYAALFDHFAHWLQAHMREHVLLRTAGLPDAANAEGWLLHELHTVRRLPDRSAIAQVLQDLSPAGADPVWLLTGKSWEAERPWPTASVAQLYGVRSPNLKQETGARSRPGNTVGPVLAPRPRNPRLDNVLEWLAACAAAAGGVGAYWLTRSLWIAVPAFALVALSAGLLLAWLQRRR